MLTGPSWALLRPNATACDFLKRGPILRRRRCVGRPERTDTRSFEGGGAAFDIVSTGEDKGWLARRRRRVLFGRSKTGKAAMVGKIEGLGGNLGDIAWIDEAGLA